MNDYIRERIIQKNKLKGYLAAIKNEETGKIYISYSLCHPNDKFDKTKGEMIARNRALKMIQESNTGKFIIPKSVSEQYCHFVLRCKKYFRTNNINLLTYYG